MVTQKLEMMTQMDLSKMEKLRFSANALMSFLVLENTLFFHL